MCREGRQRDGSCNCMSFPLETVQEILNLYYGMENIVNGKYMNKYEKFLFLI